MTHDEVADAIDGPPAKPTNPLTCILITCGGCSVIGILSVVIGCWLGISMLDDAVEEWTTEFEDQGFVLQGGRGANFGSQISIDAPVQGKKLFIQQAVQFHSETDDDIAIIAQVAEIHGEIRGDLYFRGQVLEIRSDAVIHGNVDVFCQVVNARGQVGGDFSGQYQVLQNMSRPLEESDGATDEAAPAETSTEPTELTPPTEDGDG